MISGCALQTHEIPAKRRFRKLDRRLRAASTGWTPSRGVAARTRYQSRRMQSAVELFVRRRGDELRHPDRLQVIEDTGDRRFHDDLTFLPCCERRVSPDAGL